MKLEFKENTHIVDKLCKLIHTAIEENREIAFVCLTLEELDDIKKGLSIYPHNSKEKELLTLEYNSGGTRYQNRIMGYPVKIVGY
jgi:hypothetical protein